MTKDDEKQLFRMFQEKYKDMPIGVVEFGDKPDVIITIQTGDTLSVSN